MFFKINGQEIKRRLEHKGWSISLFARMSHGGISERQLRKITTGVVK